MSRRIDLLRLDYLFSVLIPLFVAIYLHNLNPLFFIDIIIGFSLLAITGNTWNDMIDMDDPDDIDTVQRVEGYRKKDLFTIGAASFFMGFTLLMRTCLEHFLNLLFLISIIILVILYIVWLKPIPILNHIILVTSHLLLPYFMIKVDAELSLIGDFGEFFILLTLFAYGLTGQFTHEVIDGDSLVENLSLRGCQIVVLTTSLITIFSTFIAFFIIFDYYFIPLLLIPFGTLYTFRKPKRPSKPVKDVGILIGNILMVYFMCIIIIQFIGLI
ncbi:MAG: conserved membrane protein of unknown function [Promethearchaeota archaeon]|nr:MAG: conserved membrane protein of unknown function [Candidatus Lokiarchaeota archaeon]